jgi:hypothetical protein
VPLARMAAVQHGSTATHMDAGGLAGTREDGDLRGWMRVDVLPPDGMQEVSGSSPLSSTGQKRNSNGSNSEYSSKVQQRRPPGPRYVCSDRISPQLGAAGPTLASRRGPACDLGNTRLIGSVTLATWSPSGSPGGLFPPVTVAAFASSPVELAVLAVRVYSQESRRWAMAARSLTAESARRPGASRR